MEKSMAWNLNKTDRLAVAHISGVRSVKSHNQSQRVLIACLTLFAGLFSLTPFMAYAKDLDLFTPLPTDQLYMSAVQTQRIDQIKQRPTTASVTLVRVDVSALQSDSIRISLPVKTLSVVKSNIEMRSVNDFTWVGAIAGIPGKATFIIHDGNITGTIRDDGNLYRVEPVGNGTHALIKVDQSRFPPDDPPTFKEREKDGDAGPTPARALPTQKGASPVGIDVLVAYTPAARTAVADIAATIQLAVAEANQSYQNSRINIRLTMVDSFEVSYLETGKTFDTILADFVGMADVNNRRNISGADMAALIINQPDFCGQAAAILANASNAFAVVHYDCATGYYSFAHELGHLQGARHDPAHDPTTTPFAYGHGFQHTSPAPPWRTIMAYDCEGGCQRLQYWSNPNIKHNNWPMGTADTSNNARVLNGTATTVARFKTAKCTVLYPSNSTPPAGYGASWNLFSTAKELLLGATCSGSNLKVIAGNNQPTTLVYKTGYRWDGTTWQLYAFTGNVPVGDWFQNAAQATIPKQLGTSYLVGYTCEYISGSWKCGCRDAACATAYWQLQAVDGGTGSAATALHAVPSANVPPPSAIVVQ